MNLSVFYLDRPLNRLELPWSGECDERASHSAEPCGLLHDIFRIDAELTVHAAIHPKNVLFEVEVVLEPLQPTRGIGMPAVVWSRIRNIEGATIAARRKPVAGHVYVKPASEDRVVAGGSRLLFAGLHERVECVAQSLRLARPRRCGLTLKVGANQIA